MNVVTESPVELFPSPVIGRDSIDRLRSRLPRNGRVDVRLRGTTLVLTGEVTSYYDKQMSQEVARRVPGVDRILNLLVVKPGDGTAEWIARPVWRDAV